MCKCVNCDYVCMRGLMHSLHCYENKLDYAKHEEQYSLLAASHLGACGEPDVAARKDRALVEGALNQDL